MEKKVYGISQAIDMSCGSSSCGWSTIAVSFALVGSNIDFEKVNLLLLKYKKKMKKTK